MPYLPHILLFANIVLFLIPSVTISTLSANPRFGRRYAFFHLSGP
jgi:hypothetical protein